MCQRNCTVVQNCTLPNGRQLRHGQSAEVDCNRYIDVNNELTFHYLCASHNYNIPTGAHAVSGDFIVQTRSVMMTVAETTLVLDVVLSLCAGSVVEMEGPIQIDALLSTVQAYLLLTYLKEPVPPL